MAVLQKIRVKLGLLASLIIALGLLLFIVDPSSVASAVQNMSSKYDVGEINGKSVSYQDFQGDIQRYTTINELITGNAAQGAEQQARIREQAWQELVFRHLFHKRAEEAGLFVGEKEMVEMTTGKDLSPMISGNPIFQDQDGNFSAENVSGFLRQMAQDASGRYRLYWDFLQMNIRNNRCFEKYASLFTSSLQENPLLLRNALAENNTVTDAEFVMIPYNVFGPDSTLVVTDGEIKDYYDGHKDFYRQSASRDLEYVVYEVTPSPEDVDAALTSIRKLAPEFAKAENVKNFLMKNSDKPYADFWYRKGDFSTVASVVEGAVWGSGKPVVSEVLSEDNTFYVTRVLETGHIPDSVYVRHILLQGERADVQADSLLGVLRKGGNFANLAAEYSADRKAAADGEQGNLGWMTQTYLIPGFESIFTHAAKKPYLITTQYGTHIVEVVRTTAPVLKKKVGILVKEAMASKETFNSFYSQANEFSTLAAGSYKNYRLAVDSLGVYSHPMNRMPESADRLGGIENTKELTRWAFEHKAGTVSDVMTLDNNYFVVAVVTGEHKEGYMELSELSGPIRERLYHEKLMVKKQAEVAEAVSGLTDLQAVAEKYGVSVSTESDLTFASVRQQGPMLEPAFVGAVSVAPIGKICAPVAGNTGIYVYKATARDTGAFFTETDAARAQASRAAYNSRMIIPVMMQDAGVKDNRARFF